MAHLFGLHPWDIPRLSIEQYNTYLSWANDYMKAQSQP
jgi:hypothetical protein